MAGTQRLATGDGSLWVSLKETSTLLRVDPKWNKTTQTVTLAAPPCSAWRPGFEAIWVPLCGGKGISRVDVKTHTIVATITKGIAVVTPPIVSAAGSLWAITDDQGTVARIDATTNAVVAEVYTGAGASGMVAAQDALWVTNSQKNQLIKIAAYTNLIAESIAVGKTPASVAFGEGSAWTLNAGDATVSRVNTKTNKVIETIKVGMPVVGSRSMREGSVWISAPGLPLARIDPRTNQVAQIFTGVGGGLVFSPRARSGSAQTRRRSGASIPSASKPPVKGSGAAPTSPSPILAVGCLSTISRS